MQRSIRGTNPLSSTFYHFDVIFDKVKSMKEVMYAQKQVSDFLGPFGIFNHILPPKWWQNVSYYDWERYYQGCGLCLNWILYVWSVWITRKPFTGGLTARIQCMYMGEGRGDLWRFFDLGHRKQANWIDCLTTSQIRVFSILYQIHLIRWNIKEWRISLWWLVPHVSNSHTWMSLTHVSNSHTLMSPPHVSNSHMWIAPTRECPSTCE